MSFKRVIQLRALKDKATKRYFIKVNFYHRHLPLFSESYDIHDLVVKNDWKSITSGESIKIFEELFGIYVGKYSIPSKGYEKEKLQYWLSKEDTGFSINLKDEDLATLRNFRISSLDI